MKFKKGSTVKFFGTDVKAIVTGFNFSNGKKTYNVKVAKPGGKEHKHVQEHELTKL